MALLRLCKPFGGESWPRQHELEFRSPPTRLALGQNFEVELVDRRQQLPDDVRIHYRFENDNGTTEEAEPMQLLNGVMVAQRQNVMRPFSYRAEGGDDHSMDWIRLEVVEPPRVESFKVKLTPPAYTGWPPEMADRQIQALRGTRLEFVGTATKRLTAAAWRQDSEGESPGSVDPDGFGFRVPASDDRPLLVDKRGSYWFELTDAEGLVGGRTDRWEIRAVPDQPPSVAIEQPSGNVFVTAAAVLRLKVAAKDDLAIHEITLHFARSDRTDEGDFKVELFRGPDQVTPSAEVVSAGSQTGDSRSVDYEWSLAPLGLKPGAQVTFFASAGDYLPQQGQSPPRKLSIITPQELEDRVAQRQAQILSELGRTLKLEQETRIQTGALQIQQRSVGQLAKQDIDHAQGAELNQRQVARALTSPAEGIPAQINDLLSDLASNRIDSPDMVRRMQGMLDELHSLEEQHLGAIERELTGAIKQRRSGPARSAAC